MRFDDLFFWGGGAPADPGGRFHVHKCRMEITSSVKDRGTPVPARGRYVISPRPPPPPVTGVTSMNKKLLSKQSNQTKALNNLNQLFFGVLFVSID